jgi:hypothetical protein
MSIPVIYSQSTGNMPVTTAAQLASTAGSILTILDIVLVNGANQLNIVSIVRTGNIAVIETSGNHVYQQGETIHLENTGEATFNGKHKIFQILAPNQVSIRLPDSGALSVGAVGTIKAAAAGWTKTVIGTNQAAYHSAPFPDGLVRTIQIEDNSPYSNTFDFRVRIATGWTALNTATKISGARRYTKVNSNLRWCVIADDKTVQFFFAGTTNYYIGEAIGIDPVDNNVTVMSMGTEGGIYGAQFGCQSISPLSQTLAQTAVAILESPFSPSTDVYASVSISGTPMVSGLALGADQNSFRYANPISGKYMNSPVDIWEKISDTGQTHYPRARAKGILQPVGKLPINIPADTLTGIYPIRETLIDGSVKDFAVLNSTSITQGSSSQVAVDLSMW